MNITIVAQKLSGKATKEDAEQILGQALGEMLDGVLTRRDEQQQLTTNSNNERIAQSLENFRIDPVTDLREGEHHGA